MGTEEGSLHTGMSENRASLLRTAPVTMAFVGENVNFQFSPSCLQVPVLLQQFLMFL